MEQGDRQAVLSAGDITLIDAAQPSSFTYQQGSRQLSLLLPRSYLEQQLRFTDLPCARRIAADNAVAKLSQQLVLGSMQNTQMSRLESEAVLNAVATLLQPALMEQDEGQDSHERILPVRWRLSISIFSPNSCAQNGLPVKSASPCVACTGYLPARGWWWRSTLKPSSGSLRPGFAPGQGAAKAGQYWL